MTNYIQPLKYEASCKVLRALSYSTTKEDLVRISLVKEIDEILAELLNQRYVKYCKETDSWCLNQDYQDKVRELIKDFELNFILKRSAEVNLNAAAKLKAIDELSEHIFYARKSVRK